MSKGKYKLRECAEIFSGFSFRSLPKEEEEGRIILVQPRDVDQATGRLLYDDALKIHEFSGVNRHYLKPGDILVSGKGKQTPIILFDSSVKNRVVSSSAFIVVRSDAKRVFPAYLSWYLQLPEAQQYFLANKAGTTVLNLSVKAVQEVEIWIPDFEVQVKIGKLFHSMREKNVKQMMLMEKERRLMNHLLYGQVTNQL